MFHGYYNGSTTSKHPCDIQSVIERAHLFHVDKMLITALTIKESEDHFELCEKYSNQFDSTAGVHPCSVASEFYKLNDEIKQGDDDGETVVVVVVVADTPMNYVMMLISNWKN